MTDDCPHLLRFADGALGCTHCLMRGVGPRNLIGPGHCGRCRVRPIDCAAPRSIDSLAADVPRSPAAPPGVGAHLKRRLADWGYVPEGGCGCDERAALLDTHGPAWCRANLRTVVGWLLDEARERGLAIGRLPGLALLARRLVLAAIRDAERDAARSRA